MASRTLDPETTERLMACFRRVDPGALGAVLDERRLPAGAKIKGRPLLQAALGFTGGQATAAVLLDRGARVDALDGGGWTALHHAAFSGHDDRIRFLLDRGADPGRTERGLGWNALHCLMSGAGREFPVRDADWWDAVLAPLVAGGADPLAAEHPPSRKLTREIEREIGKEIDVLPARDPATPLSLAAGLDGVPLERLLTLLTRPPDTEQASTAFRAAVAAGRVENARLLATLGADATRPGADGETPVSLAIERRSAALLRIALAAGGDPRAPQGKREQIPILRAARLGGDPALLDVLVSAGADVSARDRWGHSALSICLEAGHGDAAACLVAAGASEPPSLGIAVRPGDGAGVVVMNVLLGSAGDDLGLRPDDRLVSIDGRPIATLPDLHAAIARRRVGDAVRASWERSGEPLSGEAVLRHRSPILLPDDPTRGFKFPR